MKKNLIQSNLDFGSAWNKLISGDATKHKYVLSRTGWNGANQYVRVIFPQAPHPSDAPDAVPQNPYFRMADNNADADGTLSPFAVLKTTQNKVFPWTPSQGDLFAFDFEIYELVGEDAEQDA